MKKPIQQMPSGQTLIPQSTTWQAQTPQFPTSNVIDPQVSSPTSPTPQASSHSQQPRRRRVQAQTASVNDTAINQNNRIGRHGIEINFQKTEEPISKQMNYPPIPQGNPPVQDDIMQSPGGTRQRYRYAQTSYVPKIPTKFDALKAKGSSLVGALMGDTTPAKPQAHPASLSSHINQGMLDHSYHSLGGWLGFITYAQPVVILLIALLSAINIFQILRYLRYLGSWYVILILIELTGLVVCSVFSLKFFTMIRRKNPNFLRFYELVMIALVSVYTAMTLFSGLRVNSESVRNILSALLSFFLWTTYFRKSVRVRTYFGSDDYLRRSIFFKNAQAPAPADGQPYEPPQPPSSPMQNTTHAQPSFQPQPKAQPSVQQPILHQQPTQQHTARQSAVPLVPMVQSTTARAAVPYKGNGETARFFSDHVEFDGNNVRYDDVEAIDVSAINSNGYVLIIFYSSFDGYIRFFLKNGQKMKIKISGFSLWGIGTKKSAQNRFPPLMKAASSIVAKAIAANALLQIRQGATLDLAGVTVNNDIAAYKKLLRQEPIYISHQNFGACGLDGQNIRVIDKSGDTLFTTSYTVKNALLLPYVLAALFGLEGKS